MGGWVRRWPDPEERCTRTPDSGSGHTPARGKANGAGGLYPKSVEDLLKYLLGSGKHGTGKLICSAIKLNKKLES